MTARYYASFFVHGGGGRVAFEYDGVVEVPDERLPAEPGAGEELAQLVASSLEVAAADVHVLEWQRLH
ncbi:MAG: hypothetical protein P8080_06905 [Gammaproteobacteria bacterium]|jgi:CO/xanthine dehydrogenase Mo-binding subunit